MRKPKERGTGFLNFLTKIPGEIRGHELIRRRAGKLALWTNPFAPAKPAQMILHGGLRPSKPPGVHTFLIHALALGALPLHPYGEWIEFKSIHSVAKRLGLPKASQPPKD
jgi:hypothetical protein